jgi:hypothetical protein
LQPLGVGPISNSWIWLARGYLGLIRFCPIPFCGDGLFGVRSVFKPLPEKRD